MKSFFKKPTALIPAIIQDARTGVVLMLGFMNRAAYQKTRSLKRVTFYSRSKKRLWTKGETSGNFLDVVEMKTDCDRDAILIKAIPRGATCHTGAQSCFGEVPISEDAFLTDLWKLIEDRKNKLPRGSYTAKLFKEGLPKISAKVMEEAGEVVRAARSENKARVVAEISDLVYHLSVLMVCKRVEWKDVVKCLQSRRRPY